MFVRLAIYVARAANGNGGGELSSEGGVCLIESIAPKLCLHDSDRLSFSRVNASCTAMWIELAVTPLKKKVRELPCVPPLCLCVGGLYRNLVDTLKRTNLHILDGFYVF